MKERSERPVRLTYANVVATLALFVALGGGAMAAQLGAHSVGSKQLRKGAVTGGKVRDGSLSGSDIDLSSLGPVPIANFAARAGSAPPTGFAGGDLTGSYPDPQFSPKAFADAAEAFIGGPPATLAKVVELEELTLASLPDVEGSDANLTLEPDSGAPLTLVGDTNGSVGTLNLENQTPGFNPSIMLYKDGTRRWDMGIDMTPGEEGDFYLHHNTDWSGGTGQDVIYATDQPHPKVSLFGDQFTPADFTVFGQEKSRPVLQLNTVEDQEKPVIEVSEQNLGTNLFELSQTGAIILHESSYQYGTVDKPANRGILYVASDGALKYVSKNGKVTEIAPGS